MLIFFGRRRKREPPAAPQIVSPQIVFSDADVAWLQDPFRNWDRSFDLQGLSDIHSTNLTVGSHHKGACLDKARDRI